MKAATLFSGIGAPEVAMPHWNWLWHAEIEKFPSAVMAARRPNSINLGNVTADDFTDRAIKIGRPDVIVFGSPCQSFSVAGKRLGLDDPRGNLALVALGIIDRLRPRWFVFENVPGLLSQAEGRALAAVFGKMADIGYWWAGDVLDAQWFGVAQRRQRLFVVGNSRDWRHSAAVLLEPESLRRNHPPRRPAGQRPAPTIASRPTGGGGLGTDFDYDGGLISHTLNTAHGKACAHDPTLETYVTHSLRAGGHSKSHANAGVPPAVAFAQNQRGECLEKPIADSLKVGGGKPGQGYPSAVIGSSVRRLTPRECERLQGFPDDYTAVPYRSKPAADGQRYKALGNSMAVPVVRWILSRIELFETKVAA